MSEKKRRNPFEDHIESDAFDISHLDDEMHLQLLPELQALLAELPEELDHRICQEELDERQQTLCAQLTIEMVERVMRSQYAKEVAHIDEDTLVQLLTVPIAAAILAESRLRIPEPKPAPSPPPLSPFGGWTPARPVSPPPVEAQNPEWAVKLGEFLRGIGAKLRRLFKR